MSQGIQESAPDADLDAAGQAEIERRAGSARALELSADGPAAGPHAEPSLTNPDATPGAGILPSRSGDDAAAAGTG